MSRFVLIVVSVIVGTASPVLADGGTVRLSETHGAALITVFTSPTPLRAGAIDVSVLLQDAVSGATLTDAEIEVAIYPAGIGGRRISRPAGTEHVVNKLLRAAKFDIAATGPTTCEVIVRRPNHADCRVQFVAGIAPALPRWVGYWPWFTWPAAVIAVFALRRRSNFRVSRH